MMNKAISFAKRFAKMVVAVFVMSILIPSFFRIYPNIVLSGSMEPAIPVGSLAYVKSDVSVEQIQEKDIIAFELQSGTQILHRVIEKNSQETNFKTKGDANDTEDLGTVDFEQYRGKYLLCIPYMGYVVKLLCNKYVWVAAISVCAAFVIVDIASERKEKKAV